MEYPKFKVCCRCFTFNHAKYITDTMNGFTMQQTSFPFICTIVDDASTDGEQEVIKQYVAHNFDFSEDSVAYQKETDYAFITYAQHKTNKNCYFAVLFLKDNHYSIRKPRMHYLVEWRNMCPYEALCEGDDYWIDPMKLQKQIDWLDNHPLCTLVFSNAYIHFEKGALPRFANRFDENGAPIDRLVKEDMQDRDYTFEETWNKWFHPTASWVYRCEVLKSDIYKTFLSFPNNFGGSVKIRNACSYLGLIHSFSSAMCVYRIHSGGVTQNANSDYSINFIDEYYYVKTCKLGKKGWRYLKKKYVPKVIKSIALICKGKSNQKDGWHSLKIVIKYCPLLFILAIIEIPLQIVKYVYGFISKNK